MRARWRAWSSSVAKPGDLVVCLGAGNITNWAYALPDQLEQLAGDACGDDGGATAIEAAA